MKKLVLVVAMFMFVCGGSFLVKAVCVKPLPNSKGVTADITCPLGSSALRYACRVV